MEAFKIGDFIRLKKLAKYQIDRYINIDVNIFEIQNIDNETLHISNCKSRILKSDIDPIPINGNDDQFIYYDPVIAGSIINPGDPIPINKRDYSYYLESFKKYKYHDKSLYDIVKASKLSYVHEIQHLLDNLHLDKGLKINAI